ncbi:hypothetical protein KK062_01880 [Fulvivirgaceae bacterium PWU5]|uniref:Uncharacterized protein n=1 Tax=Dawidia cretensis TaxID=2782350 RepID=A0AAP2DT24_9BACT|nr:hypothetical protein [Dawidia cretensis]MBT1706951.1 hypothetical protein [Dawidia cretensis]
MALLEGLTFTGSLGDFSAYRMRGTDKIVMRKKGGARRDEIRNSPAFATARLYMTEFGGCSRMGKHVRQSMQQLRDLADYNISGPINKIMKVVQKQDEANELGRRPIVLSNHTKLLEGFCLNQKYTLDSILRTSINATVDAEGGSAHVEIPRLLRDINFFPNNRHTLFRIEVTLGVAPNFAFNPKTGEYQPPAWHTNNQPSVYTCTDWHAALEGAPAMSLDIAFGELPPDADYSLVLSVGIRFGFTSNKGTVEEVKRAGAAKVLMVVGGKASEKADLSKVDNVPATESVSSPIKDKPSSSRAEVSSGKEQILQPTFSYEYTVADTLQPTMPRAAGNQYAVAQASMQPKKRRTSRSLAEHREVETPPTNKKRQETPSDFTAYYCTMTHAANSRVVYIPA